MFSKLFSITCVRSCNDSYTGNWIFLSISWGGDVQIYMLNRNKLFIESTALIPWHSSQYIELEFQTWKKMINNSYYLNPLFLFYPKEQEAEEKKKLEEEEARQRRELEQFERKMDGKKHRKRNRKVTDTETEKTFWSSYGKVLIVTTALIVAVSAYLIVGS